MLKSVSTKCVETGCLYRGLEAWDCERNRRHLIMSLAFLVLGEMVNDVQTKCKEMVRKIILTISYRARERALWKRANSLRSWIVMTNFHTASSTTPTSRMLPTTASSTVRASGPPPHSDMGRGKFIHGGHNHQCEQHSNSLAFPWIWNWLCLSVWCPVQHAQCTGERRTANRWEVCSNERVPSELLASQNHVCFRCSNINKPGTAFR